ncbi:MAG TPA: hypothetical protein VHT53_02710 [Candidatus Elarobacter sp.]|jgi:hypothetical protein|nr:hypothetical protein [Candidatus Elarobacter sp.]
MSGIGNTVNPPLSRDALIAIGAIIATPPDADPSVWRNLATAEGATLTSSVTGEVSNQLAVVLNRLAGAGAGQTIRDQLVRTSKMLPNPPGP